MSEHRFRVTVLGSGTSTGVPLPGCQCAVCRSDNPKNNRLRTSIFVEPTAKQERVGILVDTSPDLRFQSLRAGVSRIDAVIFTHAHADHIFGMDDLRSFNFTQKSNIPLFATAASSAELERIYSYAFFPDPAYEGGLPPQVTITRIEPFKPFTIGGVEILPLQLWHGKMEVIGYRIGNFAYLTDCNSIPEESANRLKGLDYLILDGLRRRPHPTHFNHDQAVAEIERLKPAHTYLTHLSHDIEHDEGNAYVKSITKHRVELAYDGLTFEST